MAFCVCFKLTLLSLGFVELVWASSLFCTNMGEYALLLFFLLPLPSSFSPLYFQSIYHVIEYSMCCCSIVLSWCFSLGGWDWPPPSSMMLPLQSLWDHKIVLKLSVWFFFPLNLVPCIPQIRPFLLLSSYLLIFPCAVLSQLLSPIQ